MMKGRRIDADRCITMPPEAWWQIGSANALRSAGRSFFVHTVVFVLYIPVDGPRSVCTDHGVARTRPSVRQRFDKQPVGVRGSLIQGAAIVIGAMLGIVGTLFVQLPDIMGALHEPSPEVLAVVEVNRGLVSALERRDSAIERQQQRLERIEHDLIDLRAQQAQLIAAAVAADSSARSGSSLLDIPSAFRVELVDVASTTLPSTLPSEPPPPPTLGTFQCDESHVYAVPDDRGSPPEFGVFAAGQCRGSVPQYDRSLVPEGSPSPRQLEWQDEGENSSMHGRTPTITAYSIDCRCPLVWRPEPQPFRGDLPLIELVELTGLDI